MENPRNTQNKTKDKKSGLKLGLRGKRTVAIALALIVFVIVSFLVAQFSKKTDFEITKDILKARTYDQVHPGDDLTDSQYVTFDAFFLKDLNGDGIAEQIRGTCNNISGRDTLYMELRVVTDGYLRDGRITINGENYNLATAIVKDNEVSKNYITTNLHNVDFNNIQNGTQKLLFGLVKTSRSIIGNDTNNYSKTGSAVLTGTHVSSTGVETPINKVVNFQVDWYGTVDAGISTSSSLNTYKYSDLSTLTDSDSLNLNFTVRATESQDELILKSNHTEGTIPQLNGYDPINVRVTGTGINANNVTYDPTTRKFTVVKEATINGNGIVTNTVNTGSYYNTRYIDYNVYVEYPIEAYQSMSQENTIEIRIPVSTYNEGYNNPDTTLFANPYVSNVANATIIATYEKRQGTVFDLDVKIGEYVSSPYQRYVISKAKPLRIYNGMSTSETDDNYMVRWFASTGEGGQTSGLVLAETATSAATKNMDQFIKSDATSEDIKTNIGDTMAYNIGIYFSSQESMLGPNGWIKVYNDDTNELIETFTAANWGLYNSTNPYYYTNNNGEITPIDHIRIETSATNKNANLNVYHIKQLDDGEITDKYYLEDFNELEYIKTYLVGNLGGLVTLSDTASAHYEAPISYATLSIDPNTISTQSTQEHDILTITTRTESFNEQYWVNGTFLVKLPNDIIDVQINDVTISDPNVTVLGYDISVDNDGYYWLKILTENTAEATYTITVDANITPDPRIPTKSGTAELYYSNEQAVQYYNPTQDVYDVDGDINETEQVGLYTTSISFVSPNSMLTSQSITDYDEKGSVSIAPQIANVDKTQRTANVHVNLTNNYSSTTSSIKILGQIPFIGNKYTYGDTDLGSQFDTKMRSGGITLPSKLEGVATVYYSTEAAPTSDINLPANHWVTANDVSDWNAIKTYLIDCGNYVFATGESAEFIYGLNIPAGLDYNDVSYSSHIIYFALDTEQGKYFTFTQPAKLGLRIAKQYDLHLNKIQENTTKVLSGLTFSIKEKGTNNAYIRTTDANGNLDITGLYAERTYVIQELRTTADYVKIEDEVEFYAYVENPDSENSQLIIKYKNTDGTFTDLTTRYNFVTSANTTKQAGEDWKANIQLADEVKSKLKIIKTDNGALLKNVRFRINGRGKTNVILTTDRNGEINTSGLFLGEEYTLTEIRADGYYLIENDITFTISKAASGFNLVAQGNGLSSYNYTTSDEIPTVVLNIGDEKIPTYGLNVVKYDKDGNTLEGAQFVVKGDGLPERGTLITTDATGVATVPTLYEYVETVAGTPKGGILGEYTIQEIFAPEGYTLDSTEVKIRAQRVGGALQLTVLSGEDRVRTITNPDTTTSKDEEVLNPTTDNPTVVLGFEDKDIFTLKKVDADNGNAPLPGAKFKLYSLDNAGNVVDLAKNVNGEYIGEKDGQRDAKKNLSFTSTSTYPWTQDANSVWYTTNQGKNSNTTEMTSEDFTLPDTGNITFKWTVSSENYDKLYYTITNVNTNTTVSGTGNTTTSSISGTSRGTVAGNLTWDDVSFTLPAGTYRIKFTYKKDSSGNQGLDTGYVKDVCIPSQGDDYSIYVNEPDAIKSLNLPFGLYKLVEVEAPENYELPAREADRTYYFGIDSSAAQQVTFTDTWIDTINALDSTLAHASWNEYNDVIEDTSKNLVTVGSYSDVANFWNNNKTDEQMIQITAVGSRDAYIAKVDTNGLIADVGNVVGIGDTNGAGTIKFEKVIQTQDGGYVAVGSTKNYGLTVYNANGTIQNISLDTHGLEDGIIVKFNSSLEVQWVKLVGGNYEDFIYGVAQDINGNIVVVGGANSYDVSLKGTSGSDALFSTTNANAQIYMEGFVLSVQNNGTYNWVQTVGGDSRTGNVRATGVTATNGSGIIITACGYGTSRYITSNKGEQDGIIVAYDESGSYLWKKQFGGTQVEIMEGITNDGAGTLYAYGSYGGDSSYNSTTAQTAKVFRTDGSEEKFDDQAQSAASFTSKGSMDNIILAYQLNGMAEPDELSKTKSLSFGTNTEDEMSKLYVTDNEELLISAWAYGSNLQVESNTLHTSHRAEEDAYVLKVSPNTDAQSTDNYQVDFFDEIAGVGMDVATAALQTQDGAIIVSGKFGLPAADVATPLDSTKLSGQTKVLKYSNYQDGFLVKYDNYVLMPEIPQLQEITISNNLLQYKITTEVLEHTEKDSENHDIVTRSGGTITGQYGTFNDETYPPSNYIEFVERVKAERDSLTAIVITPDTDYSIVGIKINGEDYTNYTPDPNTGVVTIPVFREVTEDKHIQVVFNKNYSNIEVNHYEWTPTDGKTTNVLAPSENYSGSIGSDYTTHPNTEIENYEIVTNRDIYGSNATETQIINSINTEFEKEYTSLSDLGYDSLDEFLNDYYVPGNATGKYKEEKQIVNYYYKVKTYTLTVKHYIEGTEIQVPKGDGTGPVEDEFSDGYKLNDPYTTSSTNLIDSSVYEVVSDSGNTSGEILGDTTVIYYYNLKNAADLVVHHYIVGTTTRVPSKEDGVDEVADEYLPEEGTTAVVGDPYLTNVTDKMREDYRIATNAEVYGDSIPGGLVGSDDYVPENATGTYKDTTQEVIYYYIKVDPTVDNTISKTGTATIETVDDEVSYVITYNVTIDDYIGDASLTIVDTLPYTIDVSQSNLDGGDYNSSAKTITWKERVNDIDTYNDATTGTITRTKNISVVYNGIDYSLTSFNNEVKGQTLLIDVDKRSEEVEDDATTEYGFTKNAYVRKDWSDTNAPTGLRPTSVDVELKAKTTTGGTDTPEPIPSTVTAEATLNSGNSWSANWNGLKKYNSEGKLITYYVEEVEFENNLANVYSSSVEKVNAATEFNGEATDDAYVITNTYTVSPEKKNLVVNKSWVDNNNANNKRPATIKFVVYKSVPGTPTTIDRNTIYAQYTLNTATETSHTFAVDKYDTYGYEAQYEVDEQEVNANDLKFYTKSGGTITNNTATITNTFTVPEEEVRIKITKVWDDDSNSYNQRPTQVKFIINKLVGGQETKVTEYTLTVSADSEEITIPGLAKYDDNGNEIVYTVGEEEVNQGDLQYYTSTSTNLVESSEVDQTSGKTIKILSTTMTNKFEPDNVKININVKKIWSDSNNANGKRPTSVTVNLKNGNTVVAYKVLNSTNNWSETFTNLAKYDDQSREIQYTVEEVETVTDDLKFYTKGTPTGSIANGFEITNTFHVPDDKIQIPVTKTWTDNSNASNDRPNSIIFKLTGNGQEYTHELTRTANQSPTDANTWTYTFENLPKYDATGSEITYTLTEQAATVGDLAGYKQVKTSDYVINNSLLLKDIDVTKNGTNRISSLDDIIDYNIQYRAKIDNEYTDNVTLTLVDNLPYNIDTTKSYDLAGGVYNDANKTITWTGTYNFTTNKITWSDNTTTNVGNAETTASGQAFIVDDGTDNTIGFNKAITFVYKDLPLSISKITNNTTGTVQLIAGNPMSDTDTHDTDVIFKTEVKVRKIWQGDSDSVASRPSVTLYANAQASDGTLTPVAQATINSSYVDPQDANVWVYTFENLPKYDSVTREEITYVVTEDPVPAGYYLEYGVDNEGRQLVINSKTGSIGITNTINKTGTATLTSESDQISYSIVYNATVSDYMGTATVTLVDTLPYTIDVSQSDIAGGTYNEADKTITWTQNVTGINTFEDATTGNITVNKKLTIVYNDINFGLDSFTNTVKGQTLLTKTNIRSEEVTDTATTEYGFTKNVTATKEWVGKTNDIVIFNLSAYTLNGGVEVNEPIPSTVQTRVTVGAGDNWKKDWTGLDKYNAQGKLIYYRVAEEVPVNFTMTKTETSSGNTATFAFKNTYAPENKQITVQKTWNDNSNANNKRPQQINILVYKLDSTGTPDRSTIIAQHTLNIASENSYTFNLQKYEDSGAEIFYYAEESEVNPGDLKFYTNRISAIGDQIEIINTFTVPDEKAKIVINKVWDDNSNANNERPTTLTFNVLKVSGGSITPVTTKEVNVASGNTQSVEITGLDKYDENGNEITYLVTEDSLNHYTTTVSPLSESSETDTTTNKPIKVLTTTVTNRFDPDSVKIIITAEKIWDDNNNSRNKRPSSVIIKLMNGTTEVSRDVANSGNSWKVTFNNLPKFDGLGNEIQYTVEEEETQADDLKFYTGGTVTGDIENGFNITNTFNVPDEKVNIATTKVWNDNSNQSNERPESVIFILTGNNQEYTHELNVSNVDSSNANNWTYTFENLPKYDNNGDEIEYVLTEQAANLGDLANYKKEKTGDYVITNSLILKDIDVEKDGTAAISSLDDTITYNLQYKTKLDNQYQDAVTLTMIDTLPYAIDTEKAYNLAGGVYDSANKTITWTGELDYTTNKITWSDGSTTNVQNEETTENGKAYVVAQGSDNLIGFNKTVTLVYKDLPLSTTTLKNNVLGRVELVTGAKKEDTDDHDTIVNFVVDVKVKKTWRADSDSTDSRRDVVIAVSSKAEDGSLTKVSEATLSDAIVDPNDSNSWIFVFNGLPKYDTTTRKEVEYVITEEDVPTGYFVSYDKENDGTLVAINSKLGSITLTKVDKNDESIKIGGAEFKIEKLKKDGSNWVVDNSFVSQTATASTEQSTLGQFKFSNLEYGRYRITETKSSDGYNLATTPMEVEIDVDNKDYVGKFADIKSVILPEAGGKIAIYSIVVVAIIAAGVVIYKKKFADNK